MALFETIYAVVRTIPKGEIASYSQVARSVGKPRGARVVGWAMGALPATTDVPWWRVVNAKRQLSIVNPRVSPELQRQKLEAEGRSLAWDGGLYVVSGADWWQAPDAPLVPPPGH